MKNLIYSFVVVLSTATLFAQNEEIHSAKVIGSFEFGVKEVTSIYDEVTGCERRTVPHSKDLFAPNESVQIKISDSKQMAEVIKPMLPEKVYTKKTCGNSQQECSTSLCILNNDGNNLILRFTENNYKVYYNASKKPNNSIKSNMIIYGGNNGNGAIPTTYLLDKSNLEQYRLTSHRGVIEESDKLAKHAGMSITSIEENLVENLLLEFKTSEPSLVQTDLAKSIFFNVAIIKSVKRALDNNSEDCNCSPVPLYFNDKSPFICQEDLSYNVSDLLTNLNDNLTEISNHYDSLTIETVRNYLESKPIDVTDVSFEEVYVDISGGSPISDFNTNLDDFINAFWCPGLQGSDLGCCGNYSGCCWYSSPVCLAHDLACLNCEPDWFCLDGCVPI